MAMILLAVATALLAFSNGANDNFKGVASLYGGGTANYRLAIGWATVTTAAGSFVSIVLAEALLRKFTGKGLATGEVNTRTMTGIALSWLITLPCAAISAGMTLWAARQWGL